MQKWFLTGAFLWALMAGTGSVAIAEMIGIDVTWQEFHAYALCLGGPGGDESDSQTDSVPVSVEVGYMEDSYASAGYDQVLAGTNAGGAYGAYGYGSSSATFHFKPTADMIQLALSGNAWPNASCSFELTDLGIDQVLDSGAWSGSGEPFSSPTHVDETLTYNLDVTGSYELVFCASGYDPYGDANLSWSIVPEPASCLLAVVGGLGFLRRRERSR